ncbi:hypothetical protein ACLOJK_022044 [Asimina triloba]
MGNGIYGLNSVEILSVKEGTRNKHFEDDASVVEKIVNSIGPKLREASAARREATSFTIYRAPKAMRQANAKGFKPQLVSIGPYHIKNKELKAMQGRKLEHLQSILLRNPKRELKDYVEEMKKLEGRAKKCYSDDQSTSSSYLGGIEFVEMMLLDGCFLVEMFLRSEEKELQHFDLCWMQHLVSFDMLLLENQLPFFVLEAIFRFVRENQQGPLASTSSLEDLALDCYQLVNVMPLNEDAKSKDSYHHLLDLVHHHCLPQPSNESEAAAAAHSSSSTSRPKSKPDMEERIPSDRWDLEEGAWRTAQPLEKLLLADNAAADDKEKREIFAIPSAEQLQDSGMKFKRKENGGNGGSFLDIRYEKKGVIEIPYLNFSDDHMSIFQNLIAYEQCCPVGTFFTAYAFFMDDIINTGKDVRILRHSEILEHGLGSDEELAQHVNQLGKGVFYDEGRIHLYEERMGITKYSRDPKNIWRETMNRKYFHSPWAKLSLGGAILGLSLSILQAALSIYSTLT